MPDGFGHAYANGTVLSLDEAEKRRLKILYLAKWALGDGRPDAVDGTHATYHAEIRETLKSLGYTVEPANTYRRLFETPDYDFLFTMLNRGGFTNSEMLGPLLGVFNKTPYFGATPIVRGLADDKHLMKLAARARGVKTPDWMVVRRHPLEIREPEFEWGALIVKPNASSASWGIGIYETWDEARAHIENLLAQDHDVIVENFVKGYEIAAPVIGSNGPWFTPPLRYVLDDPRAVRSYEQKRDLAGDAQARTEALSDPELLARVNQACRALLPEVWPCDIGRVELKYDEASGDLNFIEVNLSCNLWSRKSCAASARVIGVSHPQFLETMLVHSMRRQGLVAPEAVIETPVDAVSATPIAAA